jgi:mannose/cellobiose epimerase-like protein (N-acyl-D-glucosamine 2-epimerase family)
MMPHSAAFSEFTLDVEKLRHWLFDAALPLWWRLGADHSLGGYHERLDFSGKPVILPRRSRVAARQAFSYSEAGRLGWDGPWRAAGQHALDFLRERFVQADGTVINSVDQQGNVLDPGFDLYNQAFALLAYASGYTAIDPNGGWQALAHALIGTLTRDFAHPSGGFREDRAGRLPLRANPHMHLLESALVWWAIDRHTVWRDMADEIVALCLRRFIETDAGIQREFFENDWTLARGAASEVVEPGHQYEWAYLLARWADLTGRERPNAIGALISFADAHGIDPTRRVAVNGIGIDGSFRDPVARLWPQTERIKAYLIDDRSCYGGRLREAIDNLYRYLDAPLAGLWYENLAADGRFVVEASPATSLYHITVAIAQLSVSLRMTSPLH